MNSFLRILFGLFSLSLVFCLCACKYRLAGTAQPLPFKTIALAQVVNDSYAPQAASPLNTQLAAMLSQAPALELAALGDSQAVLEVELDDYTKQIFATKESDTALASAITVTLTANCSLKDLRTGKYLFKDRRVSVSNHVYDANGLLNAEYQNMTVLTRELAKRIVDQVLGVW